MNFAPSLSLFFTVLSSTAVVGSAQGNINAKFYNIGRGHGRIPDMSNMPVHSEQQIDKIDFYVGGGTLSVVGSSLHDFVGAVFEGCIDIPSAGTWTFYTESDDGSKMYLADNLVVSNDGLHGMAERSGRVTYATRPDPVAARVTFFENGGGAGLKVRWAGPGVSKQIIPASAWVACEPIAHGDPHLVTWSGDKYDFHGICDLVLLSNPGFEENQGLDIHIRTAKIHQWSYVEASTIRIGNDVFEITGGKNNMNQVRINGVLHEIESSDEEVMKIAGYPVHFQKISDKGQQFVVDLGGEESIIFRTWNAFVSIKVQHPTEKHFSSSVGLMGSFPAGKKIARDNETILDDANEFGKEWQVNGEDAKLFHETREPQFPKKCEIPSSVEMRRRLAKSTVTREEAEAACSDIKEYKEMCIFDVMATNDMTAAGAY